MHLKLRIFAAIIGFYNFKQSWSHDHFQAKYEYVPSFGILKASQNSNLPIRFNSATVFSPDSFVMNEKKASQKAASINFFPFIFPFTNPKGFNGTFKQAPKTSFALQNRKSVRQPLRSTITSTRTNLKNKSNLLLTNHESKLFNRAFLQPPKSGHPLPGNIPHSGHITNFNIKHRGNPSTYSVFKYLKSNHGLTDKSPQSPKTSVAIKSSHLFPQHSVHSVNRLEEISKLISFGKPYNSNDKINANQSLMGSARTPNGIEHAAQLNNTSYTEISKYISFGKPYKSTDNSTAEPFPFLNKDPSKTKLNATKKELLQNPGDQNTHYEAGNLPTGNINNKSAGNDIDLKGFPASVHEALGLPATFQLPLEEHFINDDLPIEETRCERLNERFIVCKSNLSPNTSTISFDLPSSKTVSLTAKLFDLLVTTNLTTQDNLARFNSTNENAEGVNKYIHESAAQTLTKRQSETDQNGFSPEDAPDQSAKSIVNSPKTSEANLNILNYAFSNPSSSEASYLRSILYDSIFSTLEHYQRNTTAKWNTQKFLTAQEFATEERVPEISTAGAPKGHFIKGERTIWKEPSAEHFLVKSDETLVENLNEKDPADERTNYELLKQENLIPVGYYELDATVEGSGAGP